MDQNNGNNQNQGNNNQNQSGGGQGGSSSGSQGYIHGDGIRGTPEENPNRDPNWEPATTGAVIDPAHDGRLKENREQGVTKGTTEHSSKAPMVGQDNSGSVNADADRPAQETYRQNQQDGGDNS